jgi:hypothetical protein
MKKRIILNQSERHTHDILHSILANSGFRIFPQIPLSKVLNREFGERLSEKDRNFLQKSEFDFVVTDADSNPVFAIEFDGPKHQTDKKQIERDIRKNRLCDHAKLPLFRITDNELKELDEILSNCVYRGKHFQATCCTPSINLTPAKTSGIRLY